MDIDYLSLINDLKDDVDSIYKNINSNSFLNIVDFYNGSLENGLLDLSQNYRISSRYIVICPYDLHIKIKEGYKIYISIFENNSFINETEYIECADIEANTQFKISIAKVDENKNEAADMNEFIKAISYNSNNLSFKGELKNINNQYESKLCNIYNTGIYSLNDYIEYWKDLPEYLSNSSIRTDQIAMLIIYTLKNNNVFQCIITASGYKTSRIINMITKSTYNPQLCDKNGWYLENIYNDISNNSILYDNKLYNIVDNGSYYINTDVGWEDVPKGISKYAILKVEKYSDNFSFQKLYAFSEKSATRVFSRNVKYDKSGSWNDWSEISNIIEKKPIQEPEEEEEPIILDLSSLYIGKKISIYGDSISTFKGFIPSGNAIYYSGTNCGVTTVEDTWWMKTINALGAELCVNNSWSGRFVTNVRDSASGFINSGGHNTAQINALSGSSSPDVIIIKLGINDFNNNVKLGTYDGSTSLPSETSSNLSSFREAYAIMLNKILTIYPSAEVWCCTLMSCERSGSKGFPEINSNGVGLSKFNDAIIQLANAFGVKVLDHNSCGIRYQNLNRYMGDYESSSNRGLHPNAAGHSLIANDTIRQLDPMVRTRYE